MTREEKCELAIERGYTYNSEIGNIYNRFGKISKIKHPKGYIDISITINKKTYHLLAHHFAWYSVYGNCNTEHIDHINGVRNDNRICNLRSVTRQQNQWNFVNAKGYYWNKRNNKWQSQIKVNKKTIFLGLFNIEQEARNAYVNAKEKYHII
jgi:hypothetical protein